MSWCDNRNYNAIFAQRYSYKYRVKIPNKTASAINDLLRKASFNNYLLTFHLL
jgi:hypothetical protein